MLELFTFRKCDLISAKCDLIFASVIYFLQSVLTFRKRDLIFESVVLFSCKHDIYFPTILELR